MGILERGLSGALPGAGDQGGEGKRHSVAFWHLRGIQRRWMFNNLGMVVLGLLVVVAAFSIITSNYYYSTMRSNLETRAASDTSFINQYTSRSDYDKAARSYIQYEFREGGQFELQYLTAEGLVDSSSNGLTISGSKAGTDDVENTKRFRELSYWMGENPQTGERILSVTAPLLYGEELAGMMRYVTSMEKIDRQVVFVSGLSLLLALVILAVIYFSNVYFVRSIVNPVVEITGIAKRIAAGSYGIQVERRPGEKKDDEIEDLTQAINDMSRSIKQAENIKSEFISSVSHELRTPLTAITGWAETIMNGETRNAADVRKGMGIIASEARRLTGMVEELLEFSRIEDGRFTLSVENMDIKAELEDAVYTYREFFASEGILLTHTDCEAEFPNMVGDPARLRQVFCNLLDNAAKHGGAGKRIDTAILSEGSDVVITIRDYGPGIPEDELPHVKYKFYECSSTARGSGIGLAICDEIISRHNGTLTLGNAEGGGCIVTIRLPAGT